MALTKESLSIRFFRIQFAPIAIATENCTIRSKEKAVQTEDIRKRLNEPEF